jgi:hypothetical protein
MNTDPFPPKIIIEHHNGQQTFCALKDVVDGVPRYDLPCPDCGGTGGIDSGGMTPWGAPISLPWPSCGPKTPPTRMEADTNRAMDLIGKAFGS